MNEVEWLITYLCGLVSDDELTAIADQLRSDEGPQWLRRGCVATRY